MSTQDTLDCHLRENEHGELIHPQFLKCAVTRITFTHRPLARTGHLAPHQLRDISKCREALNIWEYYCHHQSTFFHLWTKKSKSIIFSNRTYCVGSQCHLCTHYQILCILLNPVFTVLCNYCNLWETLTWIYISFTKINYFLMATSLGFCGVLPQNFL